MLQNGSKASFPLCVHNRVSLESVRNGLVKAVMKGAAKSFLKNYGIEFDELKTGFVCIDFAFHPHSQYYEK